MIRGSITSHSHPEKFRGRKRGLARMRRLTVVAEEGLLEPLEAELARRGVRGIVTTLGREIPYAEPYASPALCRVEMLVSPEVCDQLVDELTRRFNAADRIYFCVDNVFVSGSVLMEAPLPIPVGHA